jgi:CheY-like chemotaxis protein
MPHKLLLADDSVTIQRVIELTFADEDIQVLAVGDGKKAIASIQSERPDIVLADVGMPERDGYEVAAFVKTNTELAHIPVLLLTGAFEPVDEARARAVGCDGVLVKPFEPQMVINRVKDLLAGRKPAGLWTSGAAPSAPGPGTGDPRPAASQPQAPAAAAAGSLEDYFDRLDAAFANMEGAAPPPAIAGPQATPATKPPDDVPAPPRPQAPPAALPRQAQAPVASALPEGIADWDPDLTGDPRKPAPLDPPPIRLDPSRGFAPIAPPRPATPPAPLQSQAVVAPPSAAPAPPPAAPALPVPTLAEAFATLLSAEQGRPLAPSAVAAPNDAFVEDVVRRVIVRMGDRAVRDTVSEIAERLVREEIARIKSA